MQKAERRRYKRVKDDNISIELSGEGFSIVTQSLDISASGIYCSVNAAIPVMTRVEIALVLPGSSKSNPMKLEGVVVRELPVKKGNKTDHYDIAIFFNTITEKEREKLIKYIDSLQV